jgi:hypothetical protein
MQKITMGVEGMSRANRETPKGGTWEQAGQGTKRARSRKIGTHAFTRDPLPIWAPRRRLSWVHPVLPDSSWDQPAKCCKPACWPGCFALDVKLLLTGQSYIRIDARVVSADEIMWAGCLPDYL